MSVPERRAVDMIITQSIKHVYVNEQYGILEEIDYGGYDKELLHMYVRGSWKWLGINKKLNWNRLPRFRHILWGQRGKGSKKWKIKMNIKGVGLMRRWIDGIGGDSRKYGVCMSVCICVCMRLRLGLIDLLRFTVMAGPRIEGDRTQCCSSWTWFLKMVSSTFQTSIWKISEKGNFINIKVRSVKRYRWIIQMCLCLRIVRSMRS